MTITLNIKHHSKKSSIYANVRNKFIILDTNGMLPQDLSNSIDILNNR